MEKLKDYIKGLGIKPSVWAINHDISPATLSRYFHGKVISPKNALKIVTATDKRITLDDLYKKGK